MCRPSDAPACSRLLSIFRTAFGPLRGQKVGRAVNLLSTESSDPSAAPSPDAPLPSYSGFLFFRDAGTRPTRTRHPPYGPVLLYFYLSPVPILPDHSRPPTNSVVQRARIPRSCVKFISSLTSIETLFVTRAQISCKY